MVDPSPPPPPKNNNNNNNNKHNKLSSSLTVNNMIVKPFWKMAAWWGMRRLTGTLQQGILGNSPYSNTLTHFETTAPVMALTIDDGLCRGGGATSMTQDVLSLLKRYNATATFFVCTDYLQEEEENLADLLQQGHELGNHMQSDQSFYYHRLKKEDFRTQLRVANAILSALEQKHQDNDNSNQPATSRQRWFRAPQGILTNVMKGVLEDEGMLHALGDVYCDDWKFAQDMDNTNDNIDNIETEYQAVMNEVANLMLSQAQTGSIAIFHMPEKGFRQGILYALEIFLQGIQQRGWKCCSLSDIKQKLVLEDEEMTANNGNSDT